MCFITLLCLDNCNYNYIYCNYSYNSTTMINQELLEKFKRLYQEQFNITLTDEEATLMATDFLNLMKILVSPDPEDTQTDKENRKELPEEANHETQQI